MIRIVSRFYAACAAPTRRVRRVLCMVTLMAAVGSIAFAMSLMRAVPDPRVVTVLFGIALVMLALSVRLALNDMRDVREQYRRSRRDLFVSTFSDEEFQQAVREKHRRKVESEKSDT